MKELMEIQASLKAPKNQYNSFGQYNYRSCEDILEGVKPLLKQNNAVLTISDDIIQVGDRNYVKATATFTCGEQSVSVSACAREPLAQKGMGDAQITGSTSSYARKYALNGLFAIDDTKDDDTKTDGAQMGIDPIDWDKVNNAIGYFKKIVDNDDIGDHDKVKKAWGRLTNDERMKVMDGLDDKPSGSKKKYRNILKEYLDYKPETLDQEFTATVSESEQEIENEL